MELSNYRHFAYGNTTRGMATAKKEYNHQQKLQQHAAAFQSVPCMIYAHCPSGKESGLTTTLDCLSFLKEVDSPSSGIVNDSAHTSPSMEQRLKAVFSDKFDDAVHNRLTGSFISPPDYSYCSDKEAFLTGPTTQFSGSSLQSDKSPQCCSSNASLSSPFTSSSGDSVCDVCLLRDGCQGNPHHELQTLHRFDYPLTCAAAHKRGSVLTLPRAANCFKAEPLFHLLNSIRDSSQSAEIDDHSTIQSKEPSSVVASSVLVPKPQAAHRNPPRVVPASSTIGSSCVSGGTRAVGNNFQPSSDLSGLQERYSNRFCRGGTVAEQHGCEKHGSFLSTQPSGLSQQKRKNEQPATPYGSERRCQDGCQEHSRTALSETIETPLSPYESIETEREGWTSNEQNHKNSFLDRLQPNAAKALGFSNLSFQSFSGDLLDRWATGREETGSNSLSGPSAFSNLMAQSLSPSTSGGIGSLWTAPVVPVLQDKTHISDPRRVELLLPARQTQRVSVSSIDKGETSNPSGSTPVADSFLQHLLQSSYCPSAETRSTAAYNCLLDSVCEPDNVNPTVQAFLQHGIVSGCDNIGGKSVRPWKMLDETSSGVVKTKGKKSTPLAVTLPVGETLENGPIADTTASVSHPQFPGVSSGVVSKPLYKPQHASGALAHVRSWGPASSLESSVKESQPQFSVLLPNDSVEKTPQKTHQSSALLLPSLSDSSKDSGRNVPASAKGMCLVYKRIDEISDFPEPRLPPKQQQQQPMEVEPQVNISKKQQPSVTALQQRDDNNVRAEKWQPPYSSRARTVLQQNDNNCNEGRASDRMHHLSLTLVHPLRDRTGMWPLDLAMSPSGQRAQYALTEAKCCDHERVVEHKKPESPSRNTVSHIANDCSVHDVPIMSSTLGHDKSHRRFATQGNIKIVGLAKTASKNSFKDSLPKNLQQHPATCKPCAFFWTKGCENGDHCQFCHEWHAPIRKKPMKDQKNLMIIARPDGKIELLRCTTEEALERS